MEIVAIIQARICSTRLPKKILLKLSGKTILERVIERVKASRMVRDIVVATTVKKEDLAIVGICAKLGISVFCGSESDVLDRYYQAARLFGSEQIVRITADCPLIDPEIIDQVVKLHLKEKADYSSNTIAETYPDGEDVEIFTFAALKQAWEKAMLMSEREHVTPYLRKRENGFKIAGLNYKKPFGNKRWTVDNPEDYRFLKKVYANVSRHKKAFTMEDVLAYLSRHPEVEKINQHIERNEGYAKSLRKDNKIG